MGPTDEGAVEDAALAPLLSGGRFGRYVVLRWLGTGHLGTVFAAYDPASDRRVALKFWHPGAGVSRQLVEARALAELSHPNVLPIYETGVLNGRVFLVMEYVGCGTLRDWQEKAARRPEETLAMYLQAGRGLAEAHRTNIVHCAFRPENVLLGEDNRPRVMDFEPGRHEGHDGYVAPEQREGFISPACDQFSFCAALYEALFGLHPFDVGSSVVREPPKRKQVPESVFTALVRGLSASPVERYPSMDVLLEQLTVRPKRRRSRWWPWAAAPALLLPLLAFLPYRSHHHTVSPGDAWDAARKAAIEKAFLATGKPYAQHTFLAVEQIVDAHIAGLSESACAETQLKEVRSLTETLAHADVALLENAVRRAQALDRPGACADADVRPLLTGWLELIDRAQGEDVVRFATQARASVDRAGGSDDLRAALDERVAEVLMRQGALPVAQERAESAVALRTQRGESDLFLADAFALLATIEERRGRADDASAANSRAMGIMEKALGHEHPAVAQRISKLSGRAHK